MSLSSISALAREVAGEQAQRQLLPHEIQQIQDAGIGLQGRAVANGQQQPGAGQGIRPRFQEHIQRNPQSAAAIQQLDSMVTQVNSQQDEAERGKMMTELQKWIEEHTGQKVTEADLYKTFCVEQRKLTTNETPNPNKPGANDSPTRPEGTGGSEVDEHGVELVTPAVMNRKAGVMMSDFEIDPSDLREVRPSPARRLTYPTSDLASPNRRITGPGRRLPTGDSLYNGEGCQPPFGGSQTGTQGDPNATSADNGDGGGTGDSPSSDKQPPNMTPGGGQGYSSKNQPLKPPTFGEAKFDAMPGAQQVDGSCPFCSAISEAGKSKYQYLGQQTVTGIGKDLDAQEQRRKEILANSTFMPRSTPIAPKQRTTSDALAGNVKRSNSNAPLSLQPNL